VRGKDDVEDIGVDWKIILKCVFGKWDNGTDWRILERSGDRWRALVLAVMKLRVP